MEAYACRELFINTSVVVLVAVVAVVRHSKLERLVVKVHTTFLVVARRRFVPELIHHAARATRKHEC